MDDLLDHAKVSRTIDDLIGCAEREIGFRERVYARHVDKGSMDQNTANREIACMKDIKRLLVEVKALHKAVYGEYRETLPMAQWEGQLHKVLDMALPDPRMGRKGKRRR